MKVWASGPAWHRSAFSASTSSAAGGKGQFPEPEHDPVIQIAVLVTEQGQSKPAVRTVLTLELVRTDRGGRRAVLRHRTRHAAWRGGTLWKPLTRTCSSGTTSCKFDLPYLIERAEKLRLRKFPFLGRIRGLPLRMRDARFQSRQHRHPGEQGGDSMEGQGPAGPAAGDSEGPQAELLLARTRCPRTS